MNFDETIAAISTPIGTGGVCMVRVCGKEAVNLADQIFLGHSKPSQHISHSLHNGYIIDPLTKEKIDHVLIGVMLGKKTYTGLDTIEIYGHGGVLNAKRILDVCIKYGARHAEPGEFTKIAFLNGKMDLSQVEAVADLIHAKTESARRSSMAQFMGNLSHEIDELKKQLIKLCSLLELDLDFGEENLISITKESIDAQITNVRLQIEKLLSTYNTGHLIREGAKISIIGKPNVGKSSLLNAMLKRNRAIVSDIPGTTRDFIEESLDIEGIPFIFVDTAGIRQSKDVVENQGIQSSMEIAKNSDLILVIFDGSEDLNEEDINILKMVEDLIWKQKHVKALFIANKCDKENYNPQRTKNDFIEISAKNDIGIDKLKRSIGDLFLNNFSIESPMITRLRHKDALENSVVSLNNAKVSLHNKMSYEFISIDIKNAIRHLGEIIGEVTGDDVLNNIFSNFCIGK